MFKLKIEPGNRMGSPKGGFAILNGEGLVEKIIIFA